jgi:hypothetical protein
VKWIKRLGCGLLLLIVASVVYVAVNDSGIVSVEYADSKNADHQAIKADLESWGGFQMAADDIDAVYMVPRDLRIAFTDCGQPNASYDPAQTAILMCYELVDRLIRDYRRYAPSDSILAVSVWQTTLFVFYHELGHALIDMLDLPVTGREEDAVDQLATIVLLEAGPEGRNAALRGAEWFQFSTRRTGSRAPYWDEHSLDQQRYFNILCWVYGSDPTVHQELLGREWGLPPARAERCSGEYDRMSRAWNTMLVPFKH